MGKRITVKSRGRIVIPRDIRERLGISEGTEMEVEVEGDKMILRRVKRISAIDLYGIAGKEKVDIEEIEDALEDLNS